MTIRILGAHQPDDCCGERQQGAGDQDRPGPVCHCKRQLRRFVPAIPAYPRQPAKRREDHIHDRRGRRTAGHQRARENITGNADIDRQLKARDKPADPVMPPGQAVNLWLPGPGRCGNRLVRRADITADLVSNPVGKQFSQWARLPVRPVDADGMDNMTFRLGEEMSVRLPSAEDYVPALKSSSTVAYCSMVGTVSV